MSLTVDFEPLRVVIWNWLNQALNQGAVEGAVGTIPIIRAQDDSVRPQEGELFVDYKFLTGMVKIGMADELIPDPGNDPTKGVLRGQRNITVSITAFGAKAAEAAAQIQASLSEPTSCSILRSGGLAVRSDESVADAAELLETKFEQRSILDVIFGFTLETNVDTGAIEIVEVTSLAPGGKKTTIDKNNGITIEDP